MEFFKIRRTIPFMRHALVFNVISLIVFVLAVVFLATKGLNFSIEFTGGTVLEVSYPTPRTRARSARPSTRPASTARCRTSAARATC